MNGSAKRELLWWRKYTLILNEALEHFGISYKNTMFYMKTEDTALPILKGEDAYERKTTRQ